MSYVHGENTGMAVGLNLMLTDQPNVCKLGQLVLMTTRP